MSVSGTPASGTETRPRDTGVAAADSVPALFEQTPDTADPKTGTWSVGWLSVWQVKVLTILGFAIPAVVYLVMLRHYQVNAVWEDQWDDVPVISRSFAHFPDWSSLWTQHTDNRLLFPNLIMLALVHTTSYNINVEEFIGAFMLFGATALLIWSHKRRSPHTPLLYYCPVAFLTLTLTQYQNMLWGFQMAWYLVLLAAALAIFVLDRPTLGWLSFLAAVLVTVVGSYSSLQGLLIWPVGLVLLYHRRRPLWTFIGWIVAAGATAALYFHNYTTNNAFNLHFFFKYPFDFLKFFLFALGDMVGAQQGQTQPANAAVMAFGVAIFVLAVVTVLKWGIRRDEESSAPIGVALIVLGFLFDALITQGRFWTGYVGASSSRYATYNVLVLVGIYLTVLGRTKGEVVERDHGWQSHRAIVWVKRQIGRIDRRVILRLAIVAIIIQVVVGVDNAVPQMRQFHRYFVNAKEVTGNIQHEPGAIVTGSLYYVRAPDWLRAETQVLQRHHLSQFG